MPVEPSPNSRALTTLQLVAIPATARVDEVTVTGVGRLDEHVEFVVAATADGLQIETSAKTGFRWAHGGWTASDLRFEDSANRAVTAAMLEQMPAGQPQEAAHSHAERAMQEGRRLGDQVMKPTVWKTRPIDVDGESFALFVIGLENAAAAVTDIGASRIAIYGARIPPEIALRLVPISDLRIAASDEESACR